MSVHEDEEDFIFSELDDNDIDYGLDDEEEMEDEMEEEEEEIIEFSDDSDVQTKRSKSNSKSKSRTKSQSKSTKTTESAVEEVAIPLVDYKRIKRHARIFTKEEFDYQYQNPSNSPPICRICEKEENAIEGGFISQYPIKYKEERLFVHKACALGFLDTARSSHFCYNICKFINYSKRIKCHHCGQLGITFCCQVNNCPK